MPGGQYRELRESAQRVEIFLTAYPYFAALEELLLPDWDDLLDAVNAEVAGFEGVFSVRGRGCDDEAGFSDLQPAEPVVDGDASEIPSLPHLVGDARKLLVRHGAVRFIVEEQHTASGGVVAGSSNEGYDGSRARMLDRGGNSARVKLGRG